MSMFVNLFYENERNIENENKDEKTKNPFKTLVIVRNVVESSI